MGADARLVLRGLAAAGALIVAAVVAGTAGVPATPRRAAAGALIMAAVLTATAVAQPAPVRVVQGSDGTLYVVQDGKYWTLMPDQIGDTELEALGPRGEIGGTLPSDLLMVPAPEAVQPPAPAPAPAAPAPPAPAPPPPAAPAPPPPPAGPPQVTIGNPTEGSNVNASGGRSYTITGSATDPVGG